MHAPQGLRFEPAIIVAFTSAQSPTVTHVRGSLLITVMQLLKEMGEWDSFLRQLSKEHHDTVHYSLAASWIDVTQFGACIDALDRVFVTEAQQAQLGQVLGTKIVHSLFGSLLSSIKPVGAESGIMLVMKHGERMYSRVYQGGGLIVTQVGPKDLHHELHGLPFASARCFQVMHAAFMRGMFLTLARMCVVRKAAARSGQPQAVALSISWV
jgi:hypothetical protein